MRPLLPALGLERVEGDGLGYPASGAAKFSKPTWVRCALADGPSVEASLSATALRAADLPDLLSLPVWGAVKKRALGRPAQNATDQRIVNQIGNHLLLWHMRHGGVAEVFRRANQGVHRLKGTSSSV
jgi:hypothetical protein